MSAQSVDELQQHNAVLRAVIKTGAGFQRCCHVTPHITGYEQFAYQFLGGTLICFIEAEKAIPGTIDSPPSPARADLAFAFCRDIDVYELLSKELIKQIETEFLFAKGAADDLF